MGPHVCVHLQRVGASTHCNILCKYNYIYIYIDYVCTYIYTYIYIYTYTYVCTCMSGFIHICMCKDKHTFIYINAETCMFLGATPVGDPNLGETGPPNSDLAGLTLRREVALEVSTGHELRDAHDPWSWLDLHELTSVQEYVYIYIHIYTHCICIYVCICRYICVWAHVSAYRYMQEYVFVYARAPACPC